MTIHTPTSNNLQATSGHLPAADKNLPAAAHNVDTAQSSDETPDIDTASITVWRTHFSTNATLGALYINGKFFCHTLEPRTRPKEAPKIPGKTAIPEGKYRLSLNVASPRFSDYKHHPGHALGAAKCLSSATCQDLTESSSTWATPPTTPPDVSSWDKPRHPTSSSTPSPPSAVSCCVSSVIRATSLYIYACAIILNRAFAPSDWGNKRW